MFLASRVFYRADASEIGSCDHLWPSRCFHKPLKLHQIWIARWESQLDLDRATKWLRCGCVDVRVVRVCSSSVRFFQIFTLLLCEICAWIWICFLDFLRCQSSWPWSSERWPGRDVANACHDVSWRVMWCVFWWFLMPFEAGTSSPSPSVSGQFLCHGDYGVPNCAKFDEFGNVGTVRAISFGIFWQSLRVALCPFAWALPIGGDSLFQTLWCLHWTTNPQIFVHRSRDPPTLKQSLSFLIHVFVWNIRLQPMSCNSYLPTVPSASA